MFTKKIFHDLIDANDVLLTSSILRSILHLIIIPLSIILINPTLSYMIIIHITLISVSHLLRCHFNPTEENIYRKNLFFLIIKVVVISSFSLLLTFILLSIFTGGNYYA
ncbi:MAG: hypothetical protein CL624_09385 [Arcobacter sp.]|nr:hypothetical protein [Arcobacter sp.]|tara:strand:- start:44823 stop:45149 length:327 start_codon:yes stop_codon:yes gene_type:complete